jgi:integrase
VPICDDLAGILRQHARNNGYVVSPVQEGRLGKRYRYDPKRLFDRLRVAAGLDTTSTPHVLRHTFASLAAQQGVSLYKIGSWMGHTMAEVTEIYAHLAQYDPDINKLNLGGRPRSDGPTIRGLRLVQK